jgi:hypothetical protein
MQTDAIQEPSIRTSFERETSNPAISKKVWEFCTTDINRSKQRRFFVLINNLL